MSKTPRHYSESREDPYCNYAHEHTRTTFHAELLNLERSKVRTLETEVAALRAELGSTPDLGHGQTLVDLASALRVGEEHGLPAPGAHVTDEIRTGRQKPRSAPPGGGNSKARRALDQLVRKVDAAVDAFESLRVNDWERPRTVRDVMKACAWCGDGFAAVRSDALWCSDRCRKAAVRFSPDSPENSAGPDELGESA